MRYIAKDEMGRVNKIYRSIVVNENEENIVAEEIKEEIDVKETLEVSVLPVEAKVETNSSRKVVEDVQVEMRIENKEEVKSYKKKERKNKAKKDIKGTFKLFSKWFFKVYDG
jgi:UDP-glucose 6-dehydrogenase